MVQLDFADADAPQLLLCTKSLGSLPTMLKLTCSVVFAATLDKITVCWVAIGSNLLIAETQY